MGREHHGATCLLEIIDDLPDTPPRVRIEPGSGFIEKQQVWLIDQGATESQSLLLPPRQAGGAAHPQLQLGQRAPAARQRDVDRDAGQGDQVDAVADVAGWVTPRIGGVGPMTVAMLLAQTVRLATGP